MIATKCDPSIPGSAKVQAPGESRQAYDDDSRVSHAVVRFAGDGDHGTEKVRITLSSGPRSNRKRAKMTANGGADVAPSGRSASRSCRVSGPKELSATMRNVPSAPVRTGSTSARTGRESQKGFPRGMPSTTIRALDTGRPATSCSAPRTITAERGGEQPQTSVGVLQAAITAAILTARYHRLRFITAPAVDPTHRGSIPVRTQTHACRRASHSPPAP